MSIHDYNFQPAAFLTFIQDNPGIFESNETYRVSVVRNMLIDLVFQSEKTSTSLFANKKQYAEQVLIKIIEHNPQFIFLEIMPGKSLFYSVLTLTDPKILDLPAMLKFHSTIVQAAVENKNIHAPQDIIDKVDIKNFIRNYAYSPIYAPILENNLLSIDSLKLLVRESQKSKKRLPIFEKYLLNCLTQTASPEKKNTIMKI